jgi:hypothetical protein
MKPAHVWSGLKVIILISLFLINVCCISMEGESKHVAYGHAALNWGQCTAYTTVGFLISYPVQCWMRYEETQIKTTRIKHCALWAVLLWPSADGTWWIWYNIGIGLFHHESHMKLSGTEPKAAQWDARSWNNICFIFVKLNRPKSDTTDSPHNYLLIITQHL